MSKKPVQNKSAVSNSTVSDIVALAIGLICIVFSMVLGHKLLDADFSYFTKWSFTIAALGLIFMPVTLTMFSRFSDLGFMFSQILGTAVSGWLVWYLSSLHIIKFTRTGCLVVIGLCLLANVAVAVFYIRKNKDISSKINLKSISRIFIAEGVFLFVFVLWCYLKGFKPEAYGTTEKLMDFGFMKAMFKSEYMPPEDIWLAGKDLNYYYVGQFMATYLSKLSNVGVEYGYNLMLMLVAAMAFSLPASLISNVMRDMIADEEQRTGLVYEAVSYMSGILAGIAVSLAGNMHYVIYAKLIPWLRTMLGLDKMADSLDYKFPGYWFPDATRYIGYNPPTEDKTIHEFPLYSFVLGDLHAHVINIIFVLTVIAILYAFLKYRKEKMDAARLLGVYSKFDYHEIFTPYIIFTGFMIGLFHTTNFWDFPIYFVVAGAVILFSNCVIYDFSLDSIKLTAAHAAVVLVVAKLSCLPFTLKFHQISTSVRLTDNRTPLYQLIILWGLPVVVTLVFLGILISNQINDEAGKDEANDTAKAGKSFVLFKFIRNLNISDLFVLTMGLCAIGLILIPEVIYVKDIYSGSYKRANTMFKLTYQSYIMFGMVMGYVLCKLLFFARTNKRRIFGIVCIVLLLMTTGYFENSTRAWFGDYSDSSRYLGLDAGRYLYGVNEDDYYATEWIESNLEGRPVMLEVNGDSYTDYCRVSARTGLPTLLGWKTHEWLWQSDETGALPEIVSVREADIETIYTSSDAAEVAELLLDYGVDYIYVGSLERNKYKDKPVNHSVLQSLGTVVYPSGFSSDQSAYVTYIIKVN